MARPMLAIGTHGNITTTAQVRSESGAWVEAQGQRAERWRARTKYRDADGKVRDVERFAPTKTKAENALKAALVERSTPVRGGAVRPDLPMRDLASLWESERLDGGDLAPATVRVYRTTLRAHVTGWTDDGGTRHEPTTALADLRVREVTVRAVRQALDTVSRESGAGAAKTLRTVLLGMMRVAVEAGAVPANPVREVTVRAVNAKGVKGRGEGAWASTAERDHRRALTGDERSALLAYVDSDGYAQETDMADLIAFMLGTGVRVGEACALRWDVVDLAAGTARIAATLVPVPGTGMVVQESTKTVAGNRTVYLPTWLVERLAARDRSTTGMVFPSPRGKLRDQSNTSAAMRRILDGAGVGWATSHTFRRTAATLMDRAGMSARAIATALGHTNPSMTMNVYMARDLGDDRAAAVL